MNNKDKKPGYVYILTNPSFREDWIKIGKSYRPIDVRSKELDNTAVPLPFEIYATMKTIKYNEVEKLVHKTIDSLTNLRIRQKREFFNVAPQKALDIFRDIASAIDDAEVTIYQDNTPKESENINQPSNRPRKPRFKFSMCGIKVGEEITFDPTGIVVKVASDDSIEYDGSIYQLSPFVGNYMPENKRKDNKSGSYQGAKYFSYKGKVLDDIRKEKEKTSSPIDLEITTYNDTRSEYIENKHYKPKGREIKRSHFKFSMCGIKKGENITFDPTGIVVRVTSESTIEYEGKTYSLSSFARTFMPDKLKNRSGRYQGPRYFSYKGKILDDIRKDEEYNARTLF